MSPSKQFFSVNSSKYILIATLTFTSLLCPVIDPHLASAETPLNNDKRKAAATSPATVEPLSRLRANRANEPWHGAAAEARLIQEAQQVGGAKPIYGPDNRMDWGQLRQKAREAVILRATATVALFSASTLETEPSGRYKVKALSLGTARRLCAEERFTAQLTGAFCSGVLVKPDIVATAGHCVQETSGADDTPLAKDIHFIFGFVANNDKDPGRTEFDPKLVFRGKELVTGQLEGGPRGAKMTGEDWALVRLDRNVPAAVAAPVPNISKAKIHNNAGVYVIGHPSGLPLKYAPGANVRINDRMSHFVANLDTFGGNSGSGVFAENTDELVGLLVRGAQDYYRKPDEECVRAFLCPNTGCDGEDVTRIEHVKIP